MTSSDLFYFFGLSCTLRLKFLSLLYYILYLLTTFLPLFLFLNKVPFWREEKWWCVCHKRRELDFFLTRSETLPFIKVSFIFTHLSCMIRYLHHQFRLVCSFPPGKLFFFFFFITLWKSPWSFFLFFHYMNCMAGLFSSRTGILNLSSQRPLDMSDSENFLK